MERIPESLRMKMMVDSILLLKNQNGWNKIHYNIKKSPLYLIKTYCNTDIDSEMVYENILRANTIVYFVNGKTFTWLKKGKAYYGKTDIYKDVYYHKPKYMDACTFFPPHGSFTHFQELP